MDPVSAEWQTMGITVAELPASTLFYHVTVVKPTKLNPGAWEKFANAAVIFTINSNKLVFTWYSVSIVPIAY